MANTIKIDGRDLTDVYGTYSVRYLKVSGNNSRYSIGGNYKGDVRAVKAVITLPKAGFPQSNGLLAVIADIAAKKGEVSLFYYDPRYVSEGGGYRTIDAIIETEPEFLAAGDAVGGTAWNISSFSLREV